MKSVAMFGYLRKGLGKSATKQIRNEGKVPCVLYGGTEHIHFSMYAQDFKPLVYTPNTYKVKLDLDGKIYRAILKDLQLHPVNDFILHADFVEINEEKPIDLAIPVHYIGNAVGVRAGGKLIVKSKKIRVKGLPALMPDFIEVNVEHLDIGKSIKVGDLKIDNLTILEPVNNPIVSVKVTRAVVEDKTAAPAAATSAAAPAADAKKK